MSLDMEKVRNSDPQNKYWSIMKFLALEQRKVSHQSYGKVKMLIYFDNLR